MLIGLVIVVASAGARGESTELALAIRQLRQLDEVGGEEVGFDSTESRFHHLLRACLAEGGPTDFEAMVRDAHPVVRSMGLVCLARVRGERAVPVLESHLGDDGRVDYAPGG